MLVVCVGWPLASPPVPCHSLGPVIASMLAKKSVVIAWVGHVGALPGDLPVLDLPEDVAAELAVVALLLDRVAAAAVDHHAVRRVRDGLGELGRVLRARVGAVPRRASCPASAGAACH